MRIRLALVVVFASMLVAPFAFAREPDYRVAVQTSEFGWVLVSNGATIAATLVEWNRLDELITDDDRVLFARFGGDEFLIRDRHTLDRADELVEPIRKLGEKARAILAARAHGGDKIGRREWKERLRPLKEKRRELLRDVTGAIEALARDAVRQGRVQRVN